MKKIKNRLFKAGGVKPLKWITVLSLIFIITACASFKPLKLDPESAKFYNYARYLFTKQEERLFSKLSTKEDREEFIENFWAIRDPNPDTEINEFKIEIQERYEYAVKYLKESHVPGWKTDRGMIYIVLGPPLDKHRERALTNSRIIGYIFWYYGFSPNTRLYILFADYDGDDIYQIDPINTSLDLLSKLDDMKYQIMKKEDVVSEKTKLKFDLEYQSSKNNFHISLDPEFVTFERTDSSMTAKFRINLVVYRDDETYTRHSRVETVELSEEELTSDKTRIRLVFPLRLEKGKYKIDAFVTDLFGENSKRRFFTVKVK